MRLTAVAVIGGVAVALPRLTDRDQAVVDPDDADVVVHTTPGCVCCHGWIDTMRAEGFTVAVVEQTAAEVVRLKAGHGLLPATFGCHTSLVQGYVLEGHVPPADIRRLLEERPPGIGLAVPGMPPGSPGMTGRNDDGYDVLLVDSVGGTSVFRTVPPDGGL